MKTAVDCCLLRRSAPWQADAGRRTGGLAARRNYNKENGFFNAYLARVQGVFQLGRGRQGILRDLDPLAFVGHDADSHGQVQTPLKAHGGQARQCDLGLLPARMPAEPRIVQPQPRAPAKREIQRRRQGKGQQKRHHKGGRIDQYPQRQNRPPYRDQNQHRGARPGRAFKDKWRHRPPATSTMVRVT